MARAQPSRDLAPSATDCHPSSAMATQRSGRGATAIGEARRSTSATAEETLVDVAPGERQHRHAGEGAAQHDKASFLQYGGDPVAQGKARRDAEVTWEVTLKRGRRGDCLHEMTWLDRTCFSKISTYYTLMY